MITSSGRSRARHGYRRSPAATSYYGGLYDLMAAGRDYDSDRLLARFAVVQRARMVAW
jgi:hypothetical protein